MYMLDTNICIYIINHNPPVVFEKFRTFALGELCISSITASELAFSVEKSGSAKNKAALQKFLAPLDILSLDDRVIWHYAEIRHYLERNGMPIGSLDMLIAAHAITNNCTLVTNNTGEFKRVPGLKLENWV